MVVHVASSSALIENISESVDFFLQLTCITKIPSYIWNTIDPHYQNFLYYFRLEGITVVDT